MWRRNDWVAALVVFGLVIADPVFAAKDGLGRWWEFAHVYATVVDFSDASIIAASDAALAPLGFHRSFSSGTTYPHNQIPGIFASYKARDSAAAMIVQGSRPGCLVFSVTNYEQHSAGLAQSAAASIEARFRKSFGHSLRLFSDARCTHSL